jgi:hypothetical protein
VSSVQRQKKPALKEAAADLRYLLNRGYPRDAALQLIGNRYNLDHDSRHLLRRGVCADAVAEDRRKKQVTVKELKGAKLAIDGHNCIITVESAIKGRTICLADDGFIRDIAGISAGYRATKETDKVLELIMEFLHDAVPAEARFLLDSPIKGSGRLAAKIRALMATRGIEGAAEAIKVPERIMAGWQGIVASSDGAVIDQARQVFDLAGHIIRALLGITVPTMQES